MTASCTTPERNDSPFRGNDARTGVAESEPNATLLQLTAMVSLHALQRRRRIDDDDSPLLWRLAAAVVFAVVALAAAGSLLA